MWIKNRFKSFGHALNGIFILMKDEPNTKIHILAAIVVVIFGIFFNINTYEWCLLIICIIVVLGMELINTSIENLSDVTTNKIHPYIKKAKDTAAGAVLVVALGAAIIGTMIFYPYFLQLL